MSASAAAKRMPPPGWTTPEPGAEAVSPLNLSRLRESKYSQIYAAPACCSCKLRIRHRSHSFNRAPYSRLRIIRKCVQGSSQAVDQAKQQRVRSIIRRVCQNCRAERIRVELRTKDPNSADYLYCDGKESNDLLSLYTLPLS